MAATAAPVEKASASSAVPDQHTHSGHRRNRSKKDLDDPFLTRSLTAEVGNLLRQPSPNRANDDAPHDSPSLLLADLFLTPVHMISFVFSLALVDRQQRQWRLSQHNTGATTGWSPWLVPEPYQAAPKAGAAGDGRPAQTGTATNYSGWYNRKKKRAMAKMEISDAFEMRKRVVFAMFVWSSLALWAVVHVLGRAYGWAFKA